MGELITHQLDAMDQATISMKDARYLSLHTPAATTLPFPSIHTLPPEMLALVFEHGAHLDASPEGQRQPYLPFPMLVSQVCSSWRLSAVNNPRLWTYIHLVLYRSLAVCAVYLARSHPCALDIYLSSAPARARHDRYELEAPLALLLAHVSRWRSFTVITDRELVMRTFAEALAETLDHVHAPMLESLSLLHSDHTWWNDSRPVHPFRADAAPRLRSVKLRNVTWNWRVTCPSALTELNLAIPHEYAHMAVPYDDFRTLIASAPDLHKLSLDGAPIHLPDGHTGHLPQIHLLALKSLDLNLVDTDSYSFRLCTCIQTPLLQQLALSGSGVHGFMRSVPSWEPWKDANALPETWAAKYPSVRSLRLAQLIKWEPGVLALHFAHAFPALDTLELACEDITPVFRFLSQNNATPESSLRRVVPWPLLRTIVVEKWPRYKLVSAYMLAKSFEVVTTAEQDAIRNLVEHRIKVALPLNVLDIRPAELLEENGTMAWLRERGVEALMQ